jgi:hypothetical protein
VCAPELANLSRLEVGERALPVLGQDLTDRLEQANVVGVVDVGLASLPPAHAADAVVPGQVATEHDVTTGAEAKLDAVHDVGVAVVDDDRRVGHDVTVLRPARASSVACGSYRPSRVTSSEPRAFAARPWNGRASTASRTIVGGGGERALEVVGLGRVARQRAPDRRTSDAPLAARLLGAQFLVVHPADARPDLERERPIAEGAARLADLETTRVILRDAGRPAVTRSVVAPDPAAAPIGDDVLDGATRLGPELAAACGFDAAGVLDACGLGAIGAHPVERSFVLHCGVLSLVGHYGYHCISYLR